MLRRFAFVRISKNIVKDIQPHRIELSKLATETNFQNELQTWWFLSRWWYHVTQHKFESILASILGSILLLCNYKWGIFYRTFNFFTDGRIPRFIKNKILNIHAPKPMHDRALPNSKFSVEITEKLCNFFVETDKQLLLGIPRWLFIESVAEEFGIGEHERLLAEFYRIEDNNLKPKNFNFTMKEMFRLLNMVEGRVKKPIEGQLESLLERMKGKVDRAMRANHEWVHKHNQKKDKVIQDLKKAQELPVAELSLKEKEILELREEIMSLNSNNKEDVEKVKVLSRKLQDLQKKKD